MNKLRGWRPGKSETRTRIFTAARERLLVHGYTGTTLRAVATDAGSTRTADAAEFSFKSKGHQ